MISSRLRTRAAKTIKQPTFPDVPSSQFGQLLDDYSAEEHIKELESVTFSMMRDLKRLEKTTVALRMAGNVTDDKFPSSATPSTYREESMFDGEDLHVTFQGCPDIDTDLPVPRQAISEKAGTPSTAQALANKWDDIVQKISIVETDIFADDSTPSLWRWLRQARKNQRILLDLFMGIVILANALTIGASFDIGSRTLWLVVDMIFAVTYLVEFLVKLIMFGCREFYFGEERYWNTFECVLVLVGCFEVMSLLALAEDNDALNMLALTRMLKVARVARLARLIKFKFFKELLLMLTGTVGGLRTLFWSCVLISYPLYAASLVFRQTLGERSGDSGDFIGEYFASVPMSFFTVFRCLVPGECTDRAGRPLFHLIVEIRGWLFAIAYMGLVMLMQFGLFNVIIAIFVENVMIAARSDSERLRKHRRQDQDFFNGKMTELFDRIWEVHFDLCKENGTPVPRLRKPTPLKQKMRVLIERLEKVQITETLFDRVLADRKAREIFQDLEVADDDQISLFEMLDADGSGTLEVPELYLGISKLRGPARRSDLITSELLLRTLLARSKVNA